MVKVLGDAVFMPLTRRMNHFPRRFALVDLDDFERVSRSKWYAASGGKHTYVHATSLKCLAKHHELLHAYVMRVQPGERVDHINGDLFDNRKQNLRLITAAQNAQNRKRPTFPGKTSRFKGVSWDRRLGVWGAQITTNGETTYLGNFDSEEAAARAYDAAAMAQHGEYARTNQVMKLFEMADPYIPNSSFADIFDRKIPLRDLTPHRHILDPLNYDDRLTANLRAELRAA